MIVVVVVFVAGGVVGKKGFGEGGKTSGHGRCDAYPNGHLLLSLSLSLSPTISTLVFNYSNPPLCPLLGCGPCALV